MSFTDAIRTCLSKYVTFSGRASRPEYWWFVLFAFLGALATGALDVLLFGADRGPLPEDQATRIFQPLFQLAIFLPMLAAGWRRMHDTGRSGWLLLLPLAVALGTMFLVVGGLGLGLGLGMTHGPGHGMPGVSPGLGYGLFGALWLMQVAIMLLLLWWLTRPGDPGPNDYGPPPADPSRVQQSRAQ